MFPNLKIMLLWTLSLWNISLKYTAQVNFTIDCGRIPNNVKPLIAKGTEEKLGESPWHVAIYKRHPNEKILICGGTILSAYIVVSAAHCFHDNKNSILYDKTIFEIVVAKLNRDYNKNDTEYQKSYGIEDIRIPREYFGFSTNFAYDMAILSVAEKIQFNSLVHPACIDLHGQSFNISEGSIGKVSGWGEDDNEKLPERLQTTNLTLYNYKTCVSQIFDADKLSVALDKICGNNINGSGARSGDSGGGYVFLHPTTQKYFLRGIVSVRILSQNSATFFTNILQYIPWIEGSIKEVESEKAKNIKPCALPENQSFNGKIVESICNSFIDHYDGDMVSDTCKIVIECFNKPNPFSSTCTNGTWIPEVKSVCPKMAPMYTCGKINGTRLVNSRTMDGYGHLAKKNWPWLIAFLTETRAECLGSLLSSNWILTTATCVKKISNSSIEIAHLSDQHGTNHTEIPIERTVIHPKYVYGHYNIGLVRLKFAVKFTKFIFPICLAKTAEEKEYTASMNWGILILTRVIHTPKYNIVKQYEGKTDILDTKMCYDFFDLSYQETSFRQLADSEICVDFCWAWDGGPLMTYNNKTDTYYLTGISSYILNSEQKGGTSCKHFHLKVPYFLDWIESVINE